MRLVLQGPADAPTGPILADDGPPPMPGPGQVVVAIAFGGLNRIDRLLADGVVPKPAGEHVLGGQGAGQVTQVGEGVTDLEPGQLVSLFPYGGCGRCERCATGNETLCRSSRLDGVNAPGMFSSQVVVLAKDAFPAPAGLSERGAALGPTMAVAWHVLVCRGGLQRGETVAISAITSGLGACCGALAHHLGARVVGLARRASLAAIDHRPAWLDELCPTDDPSAPRGSQVHLAVDAVGAPTLPFVHRMVGVGGRIVTVGAHAGQRCDLDIWRLFTREQDLRGSHGCHRPDLTRALEALAALEPGLDGLVDAVFPAAEHPAAYTRLDTPGRLGNILLDLRAPAA